MAAYYSVVARAGYLGKPSVWASTGRPEAIQERWLWDARLPWTGFVVRRMVASHVTRRTDSLGDWYAQIRPAVTSDELREWLLAARDECAVLTSTISRSMRIRVPGLFLLVAGIQTGAAYLLKQTGAIGQANWLVIGVVAAILLGELAIISPLFFNPAYRAKRALLLMSGPDGKSTYELENDIAEFLRQRKSPEMQIDASMWQAAGLIPAVAVLLGGFAFVFSQYIDHFVWFVVGFVGISLAYGCVAAVWTAPLFWVGKEIRRSRGGAV
jgi:hypothetical protein